MKKYIGFFFFIAALCSSCEEILLEEDISEEKIVLVAPANNAQFFSTGVSFAWEELKDADYYHLQIARPNFENPLQIVLDTVVASNSFSFQLNVGAYEWRVSGVNSTYETDYENRFFTIVNNEEFENNTVVLISPASNLITKNASLNIMWQSVIGATSYEFQVLDVNGTVVHEEVITVANLSYTFQEGNFSWRVRASNGSMYTLYTSRSLLIDTTVPNTPILTAPVNGSTSLESDLSFQWTRQTQQGSAETDSIYIYTNSALSLLHLKEESTSPFLTTLESGTYYWYVRAFDLAGNVSNQSTVYSLIVDN
ncbi:hypothetical protein ACI6PS_07945 [Flavobacterium sp. PLA-1-15]|uniref:hypothetical protein n=1 Tax=Flavobacterium sp. PLA-1-15 TaxID=3380533 RepID=UPI003B7F82E3